MIIFKRHANRDVLGTIRLPTLSAVALWHNEILGQMSDGAWENTAPIDHWKFWVKLNVEHAPYHQPSVITGCAGLCKKTGYGIASLYPIVGDRMLSYGRMGRALESLPPNVLQDLAESETPKAAFDRYKEPTLDIIIDAGEYMTPMTLETWLNAKNTNTWEPPWAAEKMFPVDDSIAALFYKTTYTMKDLRSDVKDIKAAMKTCRFR